VAVLLMRAIATGRPGTRVIPTDWEATNRPAVEATMTATIAWRIPGGTKGPFDEDTGTYPTVPNTPYTTVPCRVQAMATMARRVENAEQAMTVAGYLVTVPAATTGIRVGHLGHVTGTGDPDLDGHDLHVDDVVRGSLRFERDLFCTLTE
jgi:hypothetical protein